MRKNNKTSTISELLSATTFGEMMKENRMGAVIKHSTIFSFWNSVVGAKFAKFTKPTAIKNSKLYVSAKSPVIIQELTLYKNKILKNINSYSLPLGIEIKDIIFNYKNYDVSNPIQKQGVEDKPIQLDYDKLKEAKIDDKTEDMVKKNIEKIKFLDEEQKKNFIEKIITTYKAKKIQDKS